MNMKKKLQIILNKLLYCIVIILFYEEIKKNETKTHSFKSFFLQVLINKTIWPIKY